MTAREPAELFDARLVLEALAETRAETRELHAEIREALVLMRAISLEHLGRGTPPPATVEDELIEAAYAAMGTSAWTVAELLGRTLRRDATGAALYAAIRRTGRDNVRSLGRYLASLSGEAQSRVTASGLKLRRLHKDHDKTLNWTIDPPTPAG
jgi:hypothetical protein